jgi:PPK2 family polyphosphate:nucleotide phosphotransferase
VTKADSERWRVPPGSTVDLTEVDPASTPGLSSKDKAAKAFPDLHDQLRSLQERLFAEQRQSLLVVLQAIDAGGKDGTIKHLFAGLNPAGAHVVSFRAPSEDELAHDFLWRVHQRTPAKGDMVVFNRSHYEDVLVVRVHQLVPEDVWRPRYKIINHFEANLAARGTKVVKLFLHISKDEQAERFRDRLDDPTKCWKFRVGDLDDRAKWDDYQRAFEEAIARTATDDAPWYVIPADHKWYRNWAASRIVIETLQAMDPQYPPCDDLKGVSVV